MFFEDLSGYKYYTKIAVPGVRTVGWLDEEHPFRVGEVDRSLLSKLEKMMIGSNEVDIHVNKIRSVHPCNICGDDDFARSKLKIGSTELWIPDGDGGFYASPSMIFHYISDHSYLPPDEFIKALENFNLNERYNAQIQYENAISQMEW
ncbi:hypothetical protein [Sphingomonas trueperi]|uniref:DUF7919 family protein n=1 Tax=Sphingomonas trueperi TaxID=53317 RepID=UPI000F150474